MSYVSHRRARVCSLLLDRNPQALICTFSTSNRTAFTPLKLTTEGVNHGAIRLVGERGKRCEDGSSFLAEHSMDVFVVKKNSYDWFSALAGRTVGHEIRSVLFYFRGRKRERGISGAGKRVSLVGMQE